LDFRASKVVLISLDGATWDIVRPLAAQGYLPNLNSIIEKGIAADLESVIPPVTASAWSSFMTGKNPSKHGIFDFTSFDVRNYRWGINTSQQIQSKTLWQILSEKNKRVIVLNLPYTYPPSEINGVMVSGWDAPSGDTNFTWPQTLRDQILEMYPDYSSNLWVSEFQPQISDEHFQGFVDRLIRGFEQGTGLAMRLLQTERWDVFMVHFQQTDWIQHKLWEYIERACKDPQDKNTKIEVVRNCYKKFDQLVGSLLETVASDRPFTIVLSDHGFGRDGGNICPNYYLKKWGYYNVHKNQEQKLKTVKDLFRKSRVAPVKKLYDMAARARSALDTPKIQQQEHASWADSTTAVVANRGSNIDWKRTKVATIWAYKAAYLFVNLVGRSSQGLVQPGAEYESLVNDLILRFRKTRHPETSESLFARVDRGSKIYPSGDDNILLPDIVLIPQESYGVSFSLADDPPKASGEGSHRHNGMMVVQGQGLVPDVENFHPNLIDIAPTVLHILGLPVPTDMEGRVLEEIFSDPVPPRYEEVDNRRTLQTSTQYTAEEADLIEQRLKNLGYVE